MRQRQPNPFKWLLLTQINKRIKRIKWIIQIAGRANLDLWKSVFKLIDEIADITVTSDILRDLLKLSDNILDPFERLYVKVESLYYLSEENDILYPLFDHIMNSADDAYSLQDNYYAGYLLSKLLIASIRLEYNDLRRYIDDLLRDVIKKADMFTASIISSHLGYLYSEFDLSLADQLIVDATFYADKCSFIYNKAIAYAFAAYKYMSITRNDDVKKDVEKLFKKALEYAEELRTSYRIVAMCEIACYIGEFDEKFAVSLLEDVLLQIDQLHNDREKVEIILKVLEKSILSDFTNFIENLYSKAERVIKLSNLSMFEKLYNLAKLANIINIRERSRSEKLAYWILGSLKNKISNCLDETNLKLVGKILGELVPIIPNAIDDLTDLVIEKIEDFTSDLRDEFNLAVKFILGLKPYFPKKVDKIFKDLLEKVGKVPYLKRIHILMDNLASIYILSKTLGEDLVHEIIKLIETFKSDARKAYYLTKILPEIFVFDHSLYTQLSEYLEEILDMYDVKYRFATYLRLAINFVKVDLETARDYIREAIRLADIVWNEDILLGKEMIKNILKIIREKLVDKVWYEQLKSYYETLDAYFVSE